MLTCYRKEKFFFIFDDIYTANVSDLYSCVFEICMRAMYLDNK